MMGENEMFKIDGKYGNVHVNGMTKDIDKIDIKELNMYLKELEAKQVKLIKEQNEYISQIIN